MSKSKILSYMKSFIKNNKLLSFFLLFLIVLVPILVFAINDPNSGYKIDPGQTKTIYYKDASGQTSLISYYLSNAGSVAYFIPTKSLYEWESVYWNFPNMDLSLEDYCGNGLCGMCDSPVQMGLSGNQTAP